MANKAPASRIFKNKIDLFYGGIADDIRIQKPELSQLISHFDIWSSPKKLQPYRSMEADENTAYKIVLFLYANSKLFGLGLVEGTGKAKVYEKSSDPITGSWTASSSGEDGSGSRSVVFFKEFHNYIYGSSAGTRLWYYGDITGTPSFGATAYAVGATAQGIITTDDFLLVPCANVVAKKDGAGSGPTNAWTSPLTLPSVYTVSDIYELGDLAYVACRPALPNSGLNSKVFIWDKISSDPSDVIDWGEGDLYILDEIEGELVGVSSVGGSSAFAIKARMSVRKWSGGNKARQSFELESDDLTLTIYGNHCKFKEGNRLVFGLKIKIGGTTYNQLFAIGRKTEQYPLSYSFDRMIDNDTALTGNINGLFKAGNYIFASHNDDGSVNRTNDQIDYTGITPTYISQKLTGEMEAGIDAHRRRKKLVMAGILCDPLTSGQSVSLYYRVNAESSWTLIRTLSTTNALQSEAGMADTNGDGTPDEDFKYCYEWQFKVTSAGGAKPTGIIYAISVDDADISSE